MPPNSVTSTIAVLALLFNFSVMSLPALADASDPPWQAPVEESLAGWKIRDYSLFLKSPNPVAYNFYKSASPCDCDGLTIFPVKNGQEQNHFLVISGRGLGSAGHVIVSIVTVNAGHIELVASKGLYVTDSLGDTAPSVWQTQNQVDTLSVGAGTPNLVKAVSDHHQGLTTHFGNVPESLARKVLDLYNPGNIIVVGLDNTQLDRLTRLVQRYGPEKSTNTTYIRDWERRLFYTNASVEELAEAVSVRWLAADFISKIFNLLEWPMPKFEGIGAVYPVAVYSSTPLVDTGVHVFVTGSGEFQINGSPTDLSLDGIKNYVELAQYISNPIQIDIEKSGHSTAYLYRYVVTKAVDPTVVGLLTFIKYNLKRYVGDVNEDLLPHGRGVLTFHNNNETLVGNFTNGLPDGLVDLYIEDSHIATFTYVEGVKQGPYIGFDNERPGGHGYAIDHVAYPIKSYIYERRSTGPAKYIETSSYNTKGGKLEVTSHREQAKRVWNYPNGGRLIVDKNKAIRVFSNGDQLHGSYKYSEPLDPWAYVPPEHRGAGRFYGRCSYFSKDDGYILEGKCDPKRYNVKAGRVKVTVFDDTMNKVITRSATFKNRKIRYRRTNLFDVFFDASWDILSDGKVDMEKVFYHSINVVGKWSEKALGTDIPPIAFSDSYTWEDEFVSSEDIRQKHLSDIGHEGLTPGEVESISYRLYTFNYKGRELSLKMRNPSNGKLRMEESGHGDPEASRGNRLHMALDLETKVGADIVSPVDGVVVHQGIHKEDSRLRTIWIDTQAEAGEKIRVKLMYSKLLPDLEHKLRQAGQGGIVVAPGDVISKAQNLYQYPEYSESYARSGNPISPHIHMEIHVREDYMSWWESAKVAKPPFPVPVPSN